MGLVDFDSEIEREINCLFFFSSRRRHTRWPRDWSSDVCSSDLADARRLALELARPLVQRAHDPLADGDEVADEVELRLAPGGEVHLVGIRDLDGPASDLELDERGGHDRSIVSGVSAEPARIDLSLEPLDDYVVVEPVDEETETRAGLTIPASDEAGCRTGIVTAVGSD